MTRPAAEPELVMFCKHCGQGMPVPDEIRTLAEAMACQIVFDVAEGRIKPSELGKRAALAGDAHIVHTAHRPKPPVDSGK